MVGGTLLIEGGDDLRRFDLVPAHLREVGVPEAEGFLGEFVSVANHPYREQGVGPQVGADDQGLVLVVRDDADGRLAFMRERSASNLLLNWALEMSWMARVEGAASRTAMPPRRVQRWQW
jgi:hypothetical protein